MPELAVQAHRGPYRVIFGAPFAGLESGLSEDEHLVIDSRVAALYKEELRAALAGRSVLRIEATESNKSLERFPAYVTHLIEHGIRRDHRLVAVGGGIIQDISAFLAATLLRGVPWSLHPTTLLAQADSCIGSKSSVNIGPYKNQLGTFTPPTEIRLAPRVLRTLEERDLRSGIGEMIKAHILSGWNDARQLLKDQAQLPRDEALLERAILRCLQIKKRLVEADEFDRGERLVLNYGHSFGHALESATDYALPHGIAVTLGMDMANRYAVEAGLLDQESERELRPLLESNCAGLANIPVPEERFFSALLRDKKNRGGSLRLVLLRAPGQPVVRECPADEAFRDFCRGYFRARAAAQARA